MMNHVLYVITIGGFFLLPLILLSWRTFRPKKMPWWLAFVLAAVLGWFLVNAAVYFYFEYLNDLVHAYGQNPSPGLIERYTNDGGKRVFALFFGWAYGIVYFVLCLLVYMAIQFGRKICFSRCI